MNLVDNVLSISHSAGIPTLMDSLTVLILYLVGLVVAIFALQALIKCAIELAVEIIVVLPVRICTGVFSWSQLFYHVLCKAVCRGKSSLKQIFSKAKQKAEAQKAHARKERAKAAAANRAAAKTTDAKVAISRESTIPVVMKKKSDINYDIPAYIRAGKEVEGAFNGSGHKCVPQPETNDTPAPESAVVSRQKLRKQHLNDKKMSKRMEMLHTQNFSSKSMAASI